MNLFIYYFLPSVTRFSSFYRDMHFWREMVRSATQHCLCRPRMLKIAKKKKEKKKKKGPI